nr:hypothetical protein [uncultured Ottowia sp.]
MKSAESEEQQEKWLSINLAFNGQCEAASACYESAGWQRPQQLFPF